MPSFEEDAFTRAQQMHRHRPQNQSQPIIQHPKPQATAQQSEPKEIPIAQIPPAPIQSSQNAPVQSDGFLNALFKDKDQSIILLLIVLLMEENSNPTLLIALIYLLI